MKTRLLVTLATFSIVTAGVGPGHGAERTAALEDGAPKATFPISREIRGAENQNLMTADAVRLPISTKAYNRAECWIDAVACGGDAVGVMVGCGAAALEAGLNPVADIVCSGASASVTAACAAMSISCDTSLDYLKGATLTAVLGANIGANVSKYKYLECSGETFVDSIAGYSALIDGAQRITQLRLRCTQGQLLGFGDNPGDSAQEVTCDPGELYTGIQAIYVNNWNKSYFTGMGGYCTHLGKMASGDRNTTSTEGWLGSSNSSLPAYTSTTLSCPPFTRLRGLQVWFHEGVGIPTASEHIVGIQGVCRGAAYYDGPN